MKNTLLPGLFALLGFCAAPPATRAAEPPVPEHTVRFRSGDAGSKDYRIPVLATTAEGTVLAVADRRNDSQGDLPNLIDPVVRRSTDNGRTWGPQIVIAQHTPQIYGPGQRQAPSPHPEHRRPDTTWKGPEEHALPGLSGYSAASGYTRPEKPRNAMARMLAVISAMGTPRSDLGTSSKSSRSRIPANSTSASANPRAVATE